MTRLEAFEKAERYNYLVGSTIGNNVVAAIMPVPIESHKSIEQIFSDVFNRVRHNELINDSINFKIVVMFNYQEFMDNGIVIWKYLDDVLELLKE